MWGGVLKPKTVNVNHKQYEAYEPKFKSAAGIRGKEHGTGLCLLCQEHLNIREWTELSGRDWRSRCGLESHFSNSGNCNYYHFKSHLQAGQCAYTDVVTGGASNGAVWQNLECRFRVKDSLWDYCCWRLLTETQTLMWCFFFLSVESESSVSDRWASKKKILIPPLNLFYGGFRRWHGCLKDGPNNDPEGGDEGIMREDKRKSSLSSTKPYNSIQTINTYRNFPKIYDSQLNGDTTAEKGHHETLPVGSIHAGKKYYYYFFCLTSFPE